MMKVFIGGSRRFTRLNEEVRNHLDRIVERQLPVLIGDANGADKAVQQHLQSVSYSKVEVFCTEGICRNNLGNWEVRAIPVPEGAKGFDYYAAKDRQMAREASIGFMLWDGKSMGTLANIFRLVMRQKKVVVYSAPIKSFTILKSGTDWDHFLAGHSSEIRERIAQYLRTENEQIAVAGQVRML